MNAAGIRIGGTLVIPTGATSGYVLTSDTNGNASWGPPGSGPQGNQGNQGVTGSGGGTGSQGNQGNQGVAGTGGSAGAQGNQGNQGTAGSNGGTGSAGAQGNQGNQGTAGSNGGTGSAGAQGNQGNQGTAGSNGGTGSAGAQGNQGTAGSNGGAGAQGNQGNQGVAGSGTAAGGTTQIQYNNANAFAASAGLTWDNGNTRLGVGISPGLATLDVQGGVRLKRTVIAASTYTLLATDNTVGVSFIGAVTLTLPSASSVPSGFFYSIQDESGSAGTNNITINRAGTDTINGATNVVIAKNYGGVMIYSDGANKWYIENPNFSATSGSQGNQGNQGTAGTNGSVGSQGNQGNQGNQGTGNQGVQGNTGPQGGSGALSIGATTIGGGTTGSVLIVGTGTLLQQDNSNLFWDATNHRLGLDTATPQTTLDVQGSIRFKRTVVSTTPYTILASDNIIGVTGPASARSLTLPSAASTPAGQMYIISDESGTAAANNITINRAGTDTIEGATTKVIALNYAAVRLYSDGVSKWFSTVDIGNQGNQGTAGSNGSAGVQGNQGNQGAAGSNGSAGVQGNQGNQGSGNQGVQGTTGPQGGSGALSIGATTIGGGTTGSVLIVGTGTLLQQDNSNLFWDATNHRLGLDTATPQTTLDVQGSIRFKRTVVSTTPYTILASDNIIGVTGPASARSLTLPSAASTPAGQMYIISDESGTAAANNITINRAGTDTIEGATTKVIALNYAAVRLYSDGVSKWFSTVDIGNQGNQGTAGSNGSAGVQGNQGNQGAAGSNGSAGVQGNQGNQGSGNQGVQGTTGPQGGSGALSIGATTIGGGTTGSVLIVGTGTLLQQDNSNLFWDATNHRLGLDNASPQATLDVTGGVRLKRTTVAASSYTAALTDYLIGVNFAGAVTITLPAASTAAAGFIYAIEDESGVAATNNITITPNGTDKINGVNASVKITANYGRIALYSTGASPGGWFVEYNTSLLGVQGNQGFQGTAGSNGGVGSQGNQGNQGTAGTGGGAGSQGNQGNQGTAGSNGGVGTQGNQGFQGFQGASGGAGAVAGTNTQLIFNNSGAYAGAANLVWDSTNNKLAVGTSTLGATTLDVQGSYRVKRTVYSTTPNTIGATDYYVAITGPASARVVNLPAASTTGRLIIIADESGTAGVNNITINRAGADTINGATSYVINQNYGAVALISDGTSLWTVNHKDIKIGTYVGGGTSGSVSYIDSNLLAAQDNANLFYDATNKRLGIGTSTVNSALNVSLNNTDFTNTSGANSHLLLINPNGSGQNCLTSFINGTLRGKWRTDSAGNVNYVCNGGYHAFYTGGDSGTGAVKMTLNASGLAAIGNNATTTPNAMLQIDSKDSSTRTLQLNAPSGQTANILEALRNGTIVDVFGPQGYFGVGTGSNNPVSPIDIRGSVTTDVTASLRPVASQTADILQVLDQSGTTRYDKIGIDGRVYVYAPNSAPTDANIENNQITFYLDEAGNKLDIRVRYSSGTLKTGAITLI
jgi:hypothetical protein